MRDPLGVKRRAGGLPLQGSPMRRWEASGLTYVCSGREQEVKVQPFYAGGAAEGSDPSWGPTGVTGAVGERPPTSRDSGEGSRLQRGFGWVRRWPCLLHRVFPGVFSVKPSGLVCASEQLSFAPLRLSEMTVRCGALGQRTKGRLVLRARWVTEVAWAAQGSLPP